MSRESVAVVEAAFEAWNAEDMGAFAALFDPDVVVNAPAGWPEPGPFVGRDAVIHQFEQLRATWDRDRLTRIGDIRETGDRVFARSVWEGFGHGPPSTTEMTIVWTVRDGRITGMEYFRDHADAPEALGLPD